MEKIVVSPPPNIMWIERQRVNKKFQTELNSVKDYLKQVKIQKMKDLNDFAPSYLKPILNNNKL